MILKYIGMGIYLLIDLFQQSFSLPIFNNHSSHLDIKFVIDLTLHALVHSLHKLLYHILYVIQTLAI
jgi:hypothetical protein